MRQPNIIVQRDTAFVKGNPVKNYQAKAPLHMEKKSTAQLRTKERHGTARKPRHYALFGFIALIGVGATYYADRKDRAKQEAERMETLQEAAAKSLGLDPESPMVKMEMISIIRRGMGGFSAPGVPFGYREVEVGSEIATPIEFVEAGGDR